jgi:hypothetical protein
LDNISQGGSMYGGSMSYYWGMHFYWWAVSTGRCNTI